MTSIPESPLRAKVTGVHRVLGKKRNRVALLVLFALACPGLNFAQLNPSSRALGVYYATNYNYTPVRVWLGNSGTGVQQIRLVDGTVTLSDGRTIVPFSTGTPLLVGIGSEQETVTPTAVAGCYVGAPPDSCAILATFTKVHSPGSLVSSATFGLQEAINDATTGGGGKVVVDSAWRGQTSQITGAAGNANVAIDDTRTGEQVYTWSGSAYAAGGGGGSITGGSCTNQTVTAISTLGVPTCTTLTSSYVDSSVATTGTDINASNQVTATHLASPLPTAQGGTGQNSTATFPTSGTVATTGTVPNAGSCTNQVVTGLNNGAAPTCTTVTSAFVDSSVTTASGTQTFTNKTLLPGAGGSNSVSELNLQTGGTPFGGTTSFQTLYTFNIPAHTLDTLNSCVKAFAQFHQSGTSAAGSYIWNVGASATANITINANLSQTSSEILICETGTNAQDLINTFNQQASSAQSPNPPVAVASTTSATITVNVQAKCSATCASTTFNPDAFLVTVIQ